MRRGATRTMVAVSRAVWMAFVVTIGLAAGQDCLTDDACVHSTSNQTVGNVAYCCSDITRSPSVTQQGACECLTPAEETKKWADETMEKGRMCLFGNDSCHGVPLSLMINSQPLVYCCPNARYCVVTVINTTAPDYVGCRCMNHPSPTSPPGAYVVPPSGEYNSSGELCLYGALCDDNPSLKCEGDNAVYCCYNSRGIHTKNLQDNTTGCTCSNDFWGDRCASNVQPVPSTEQSCLKDAACPAGANMTVVTSGTSNVNVTYCCPDLQVTPYVQVVRGATPLVICTCSLHGQEGSTEDKVRMWAALTSNYGRWCESGSVCEQFSSSLTFYKGDNSSTVETLSLCCRKPKSTCYFTAYKDDYDSIGCRCTKTWVPWTEPGAYVVPDAGYYNSTGEVCSYNAKCDDYPSVKCESTQLTLCCYGSRGIHTGSLKNNTPSCTCTNDIAGPRCEGSMYSISGSSQITATAGMWGLAGLVTFLLGYSGYNND
ncbi:uncharacterized protein LOC112561869 [Pomacea canaliculata]|uniref:uncharacterized protein LOC112561869 n=1 Tax=Pomacea canaliculata TaxID=400727 RepID=UPI000D7339C2|nr:uncharacterized protein LOC112561869 [Pomacea canaliculata]